LQQHFYVITLLITGDLKFSLRVSYGSFFVLRCTLDTDKFDIIINIIGYVSIVLTDICRSFLRVSKVTEKIKTPSKPTPSENFNSHPLFSMNNVYFALISDVMYKFTELYPRLLIKICDTR
jgi:hypothetical protein